MKILPDLHIFFLVTPGELIVKPPREDDTVLGSKSANGSVTKWFAVWQRQQVILQVLTDGTVYQLY
jgi:hypothetical protein